MKIEGKIMDKIKLNQNAVPLIANQHIKRNNTISSNNSGNDFKNLFDELTNVQFSKHANTRLADRNINLSQDQLDRLEQGIDDAKLKGIRDSLVLVDNIAMVVNIPSRTVITALNQTEQQSEKNIFTNIDGAVIA